MEDCRERLGLGIHQALDVVLHLVLRVGDLVQDVVGLEAAVVVVVVTVVVVVVVGRRVRQRAVVVVAIAAAADVAVRLVIVI